MDDRLPWSRRAAAAALGLVFGTWAVGLGLLWSGLSLGWLMLALAAWLTVGLVYTVWRAPEGGAS